MLMQIVLLSAAFAGGPEDSEKKLTIAVEPTEDREVFDDLTAVNDLASKAKSQAAYALGLAEKAESDITAFKAAQEAGDAAALALEDAIASLKAEIDRLKASKGSAAKMAELEGEVKNLLWWQEKTDVSVDILRNRINELELWIASAEPRIDGLEEDVGEIKPRLEAVENRFEVNPYYGVDVSGVVRKPDGMLGPVAATTGFVLGIELSKPVFDLRLQTEVHKAAEDGMGVKLEIVPTWRVGEVELGPFFGLGADAYGLTDKDTAITASEVGMRFGGTIGKSDLIEGARFRCGPALFLGAEQGVLGRNSGQVGYGNAVASAQFTCAAR